jgi:hypothetical protein
MCALTGFTGVPGARVSVVATTDTLIGAFLHAYVVGVADQARFAGSVVETWLALIADIV